MRTFALVLVILMFAGTMTTVAQSPPIVPISSRASGVWNDPATWSCNCIPQRSNSAVVQAGHTVVVEGPAEAASVLVEGTLQASRTASSTLTLYGNLVVHGSGWLDYGTSQAPIPEAVTARIRISLDERSYVGGGTMVPLATDVGIWIVEQGRVSTKSVARGAWTTMVETASAGATDIAVDTRFVQRWRVGDTVVIGSSDTAENLWIQPLTDADDLRTIVADLGGGRFRLSAPLSVGRLVQRVPWTDTFGDSWTETLAPEVANLSRNVIFEAADLNNRPHFMIMDRGRAQLEDLAIVGFSPVPRAVFSGPDNARFPFGRYALHFHMQQDASRGSYAREVVIRDGAGDGLHIHNSYGVVVEDLVIWNQAHDPNGEVGPQGVPQGNQAIFLEGVQNPDNTFPPDMGADDAWIDRPLVMATTNLGGAAVWMQRGLGAVIAGARIGNTKGMGFFWCPGCGNTHSLRGIPPDMENESPRVFRAEVHSSIIGFRWYVNLSPNQNVLDLRAWNNNHGIALGSYGNTYWLWNVRSIGNTREQFASPVSPTSLSNFLADGQNNGSDGVIIARYTAMSRRDSLYENGVIRNISGPEVEFVGWDPCLQDPTNFCGAEETHIQFQNDRFEGGPIQFNWHPMPGSYFRFRSQSGLPRAANFTLFRNDQSIPGGVADSQYGAIRLDNDTAGAFGITPRVKFGNQTGCAQDDSFNAGLVTLCAETNAPTVEFYLVSPPTTAQLIQRVPTGTSGFAQTTFDMRTWPNRRAYFFVEAISSNGRSSYSRVLRVSHFAPAPPPPPPPPPPSGKPPNQPPTTKPPLTQSPVTQVLRSSVVTDLRIAIAHADFGARRNSLTDARVHLALALNCIEGSSSVNSSPFRGNVCGEGNGILMNLRAVPGGAALIPLAQHADHLAAAALRTQNLSQTRYAALNVAILLRRIANGLR